MIKKEPFKRTRNPSQIIKQGEIQAIINQDEIKNIVQNLTQVQNFRANLSFAQKLHQQQLLRSSNAIQSLQSTDYHQQQFKTTLERPCSNKAQKNQITKSIQHSVKQSISSNQHALDMIHVFKNAEKSNQQNKVSKIRHHRYFKTRRPSSEENTKESLKGLARIRATKAPSASVPKTPVEPASINSMQLRRRLSNGTEETGQSLERKLNARTTSYEKRPPVAVLTTTNSRHSLKTSAGLNYAPAITLKENPLRVSIQKPILNNFTGPANRVVQSKPRPALDLEQESGIARKKSTKKNQFSPLAQKPVRLSYDHDRVDKTTESPVNLPQKKITFDKTMIQKFFQLQNKKIEEQQKPLHEEALAISNLIKQNQEMETTLNLYKVGRVIGKGAFGKVNLALHRLTRKLVAIKSIKIAQIEDENEKKKLLHEIEILKRLKHESHIKLLETFETATHICIVLELCPGGDLLSYVRKRRKLSELQAKYIFKQIIQGLHYLETVNVVHRDIKLENILLDGFGRVKIGDFGVSSKVDGPNAVLFGQCGTPAYIAPEVVLEHGYIGSQADVWSSGICLFAMVYGNVPLKITDLSQLSRAMFDKDLEFKNTVGPSCIDLLKKILMLDPKQRLKPHQILKHPWLQDVPPFVDIFDESERDLIRQEFNYGVDAQKPINSARSQDHENLNTQFTEYSIQSTADRQLLKNSSSRSVVLCPFSSVNKQEVINTNILLNDPEIRRLLVDRRIIHYDVHVREINREYEKFNNQDFDNGVYHKFAYKNQPKIAARSGNHNSLAQSGPDETHNQIYSKLNNAAMQQMMSFGFQKQYVLQCIEGSKANFCHATYYLLCINQNF